MSTGLECVFTEPVQGEWFYIMQNWDCPVGAWDWREYATAYGPFATEDEAIAHLQACHANPGGWWSEPYVEGKAIDDVEQKLFAAARERFATTYRREPSWWF